MALTSLKKVTVVTCTCADYVHMYRYTMHDVRHMFTSCMYMYTCMYDDFLLYSLQIRLVSMNVECPHTLGKQVCTFFQLALSLGYVGPDA